MTMRPGPLRLSLDNQTDVRVLPSVFIAADGLHHLLGVRKPFLTAKRMLTNQTFRDVYKADNLNVDQRLKITSLTFLFTDLKGSTALYERVGDLAAFDLVRAHFHALLEIISSEKGAVVKTIGDAVMATFIRPEHALAASLRSGRYPPRHPVPPPQAPASAAARRTAAGATPSPAECPGKYDCPVSAIGLPWIHDLSSGAEAARIHESGTVAFGCPGRRSGCLVSASRHLPAAAPGKIPPGRFHLLPAELTVLKKACRIGRIIDTSIA